MLGPMANRIYAYISSASADDPYRAEFEKRLKPFINQGQLECWHRGLILAGTDRDKKIESQINEAKIVFLLVSPDYLNSDECHSEMTIAMDRMSQNSVRLIPIILRRSDWHTSKFGKLQALPDNNEPISTAKSVDDAWQTVVIGIRKIIDSLPAPISVSHPSEVQIDLLKMEISQLKAELVHCQKCLTIEVEKNETLLKEEERLRNEIVKLTCIPGKIADSDSVDKMSGIIQYLDTELMVPKDVPALEKNIKTRLDLLLRESGRLVAGLTQGMSRFDRFVFDQAKSLILLDFAELEEVYNDWDPEETYTIIKLTEAGSKFFRALIVNPQARTKK